jgi:hypothetical protein
MRSCSLQAGGLPGLPDFRDRLPCRLALLEHICYLANYYFRSPNMHIFHRILKKIAFLAFKDEEFYKKNHYVEMP